MTPSIARIVHYRLSEKDVEAINRRRAHASAHMTEHVSHADGSQIHYGNRVVAGQVLPMLITAVYDRNQVSGQVFLDGNDVFWATTRELVTDPHDARDGVWFWPPRV